jgi:two-component system, response regulator
MKGSSVLILLVEDDPAHAEIVRRGLSSLRIANRIVHLEDGQAALDYLQGGAPFDDADHRRPDMILLDLRLPKVDGLEVMRRIKADDALKGIPTIVLTTSAAESDVAGAYANGAASFLVKPIDFPSFLQLMETFGFYWLMWNQFPEGLSGGRA